MTPTIFVNFGHPPFLKCDLASAINHGVLLKLSHYGVRGVALQLIENYLKDRSQCVIYNKAMSSCKKTVCGVPQGSLLGPLLFLIYINDIYRCSSLLRFIIFADDTTIVITGKSWDEISAILNRELSSLSNWFIANKPSLNIQKTNCIAFSKIRNSAPPLAIKIGNDFVKQVDSTKFFGIEIDHHLTWKNHITKIEQKNIFSSWYNK